MSILAIIEGLLSIVAAVFSAYTKSIDVEEGKRVVREDMYEEMVERNEKANTTHALGVDELVSLRASRKTTSDR